MFSSEDDTIGVISSSGGISNDRWNNVTVRPQNNARGEEFPRKEKACPINAAREIELVDLRPAIDIATCSVYT